MRLVYPELLGGAASGYDPGARSQCRSNAPRAAPLRRPFYRRRRAHFQHMGGYADELGAAATDAELLAVAGQLAADPAAALGLSPA